MGFGSGLASESGSGWPLERTAAARWGCEVELVVPFVLLEDQVAIPETARQQHDAHYPVGERHPVFVRRQVALAVLERELVAQLDLRGERCGGCCQCELRVEIQMLSKAFDPDAQHNTHTTHLVGGVLLERAIRKNEVEVLGGGSWRNQKNG